MGLSEEQELIGSWTRKIYDVVRFYLYLKPDL